jgi:hypothetical protein
VPSTFVAQDAPSVAQDVSTATKVSMKLDQWKEVKFQLTDKELAYTSQQIITDHIEPAAYALADKIDQSLCALVDDVPWYIDWTGPRGHGHHEVPCRDVQEQGRLERSDQAARMVNADVEGELLALRRSRSTRAPATPGIDGAAARLPRHPVRVQLLRQPERPAAHTSATVADVAGAINNAPGYARARPRSTRQRRHRGQRAVPRGRHRAGDRPHAAVRL